MIITNVFIVNFPGNIFYFVKKKKNNLLPNFFSDSLLDCRLLPYSSITPNNYRKALLKSNELIEVADFGAGSRKFKNTKRFINKIAAVSGTKHKFGVFYQKLIKHFDIIDILELGTSLGIGTMYLACANTNVNVTTIDACPQTCNFTKNQFNTNKIGNVKIINAEFDKLFEKKILLEKTFDLVFIDGNHKGDKLIEYFEILKKTHLKDKYIIIADDINWSRDMYQSWKKICSLDPDATYFNLYRCGIIFKNHALPKGIFPIKFVNNKFN